jgi:hypothetical protein
MMKPIRTAMRQKNAKVMAKYTKYYANPAVHLFGEQLSHQQKNKDSFM